MTDRERLLELADAVISTSHSWSITAYSREAYWRVERAVRLAKEAFNELDKEAQEWDNEGGQ